MAIYRFDTTASMKEYNRAKWYIDPDIVRPFEIDADNLKSALEKWRDKVQDRDYIEISDNALRTKNPMYIDTKDGETVQTGYVITGKTAILKGEYRVDPEKYVVQYVELWVNVSVLGAVDF